MPLNRPIKSTVLALTAILFGCSPPKQEDLVGTYSAKDGSSNLVVQLKANGTFARYNNGRKTSSGRWHLNNHPYFDAGIEFDEEDPNSGFSADEYRLTYRAGAICWEVRRDYEYWCKASQR